MDAKITKSRLGLLLSYDWIKIIGICLAAVLLWALLYTMLATRATGGQKFEIYSYMGVRLNADAVDDLDVLHQKQALSPDVLDFSTYTVNDDSYADTVLSAHFAAGQGDIMFAADSAPETDENGNVTAYTGLSDFLMSYSSNSVWLGADGYTDATGMNKQQNYFTQCANYLGRFFKNEAGEPDFAAGTLDKKTAEENFRARIKGDKRYKNETQRLAALEDEYARLEALRESYKTVLEWVTNDSDADPVELRTVTLNGQNKAGENVEVSWTFAFDLSNIGNIAQFVANTSGESATGDDMCMVVLEAGSSGEEDMRYEPFTFLTYLAEKFAA